jgi:predicted acyl esterase
MVPVRIVSAQTLLLQLSSTAPDADICVNLVDVELLGFAYNVSDGFLCMQYRRGSTADWLRAGVVEEVRVLLANTPMFSNQDIESAS